MLPRPWNPHEINPALMTSREYLKLCNEDDKWHGDHAYNVTLADLNQGYSSDKPDSYQRVRRLKVNGITLDLMIKREKRQYAMRDTEKEFIRIGGEIQFYSDEEVRRLGFQPEEFTLAIFDGDKRVASAQDEWGCMLIMVAREYREFGLGTIIGKAARTLEPGKTSGGFTAGGARNFVRLHREFVRDALASGFYSKLVHAGSLTIERAKEIVQSVKAEQRPREKVDLASNDPRSWLLFADGLGTFILYDRKLASLVHGEKYETFTDRMIKGYVYCQVNDSRDGAIARIKQFGAESPKLAAFMLSLAHRHAKDEKASLWVEAQEYDLPGFRYGEEEHVVGYRSREVLDGPAPDYHAMAQDEARFRASFDRYQEFEYRLQDMAHGKY